MLESWDAARDFIARDRAQKPQAVDIAEKLGWTGSMMPRLR